MFLWRVWAPASLFRRFTDTNVYGTGSVKRYGKLATKYGFTDIFFTVRIARIATGGRARPVISLFVAYVVYSPGNYSVVGDVIINFRVTATLRPYSVDTV